MEGRAEANYELFELFVDESSIVKINAEKGDDKDGCKVGMISLLVSNDL